MSIKGFNGDNQYLSNFYHQPFNYNGIAYNNVVCAFCSQPITNEMQKNIIAKSLPSEAIKLYNKTKNKKDLSKKDKIELMYQICKEKFSIPSLSKKLLATGKEELINETTWDNTFWGITKDKGENQLGKILMRIRNELFKQQKENNDDKSKEEEEASEDNQE